MKRPLRTRPQFIVRALRTTARRASLVDAWPATTVVGPCEAAWTPAAGPAAARARTAARPARRRFIGAISSSDGGPAAVCLNSLPRCEAYRLRPWGASLPCLSDSRVALDAGHVVGIECVALVVTMRRHEAMLADQGTELGRFGSQTAGEFPGGHRHADDPMAGQPRGPGAATLVEATGTCEGRLPCPSDIEVLPGGPLCNPRASEGAFAT